MTQAGGSGAVVMRLGDRLVGPGHAPLFTAEEGQANGGDLDVALRMIGIAAGAGVDAIEFQLARAGDFYVRHHPGYEIYKKREFSEEALARLAGTAREAGLMLCVAPLAAPLVPLLARLGCSFFNVNSSDLDNPEMLDAVAGSGLPFFLSTAMATAAEVEWAVERVRARGAANFGLLHGQHVMASADGRGVPEDQVNLAAMATLRARHDVPVGFIDHTSGPHMPAIAVAHGADVVTKHFTWDRGARGPDWHVCLEPSELAQAVGLVRMAHGARGQAEKALIAGEGADRSVMRRSVVAAHDLAAGAVLQPGDLAYKRPGGGLSPRDAGRVLGRRLRVALAADQAVRPEDVEG
jgi:sialic acid synthase SpsE